MKKLVAVIALPLSFLGSVQAAVPTEVSTAVTTAGTDAATLGGLVLVAIIGIFAIKFMKRAL